MIHTRLYQIIVSNVPSAGQRTPTPATLAHAPFHATVPGPGKGMTGYRFIYF
jgi:hypothetical protein